jgi:FxLD family lantipeptide
MAPTNGTPVSILGGQPSFSSERDSALDLDVRIVVDGPVSAALLSSTDDGCDTVRGSDC